MTKQKIHPYYTDTYYYEDGDTTIFFKRTRSPHGGMAIYTEYIEFNTAEEAKEYFEQI